MTVEKLIDAIAEALFQEFGSDYDIYTEKVEQGLEEPCFLVRCLNPTKNLDLGSRYRRTNRFSIQYIPSSDEANKECFSVMERLFHCLKDVFIDEKPIHGKELECELVDEVLTLTVNYDGFELEEHESVDMAELEISTKMKG